MKTFYISFGQSHVHRLNGVTLDADGLLAVKAADEATARDMVFRMIGRKWAMVYEKPNMTYFPRGVVLEI